MGKGESKRPMTPTSSSVREVRVAPYFLPPLSFGFDFVVSVVAIGDL